MLDLSTPKDRHIDERLRSEPIIWLATTRPDGSPHNVPVWFWWDGETFLVYNRADAHRLRHVRTRPLVALNFDGDGRGGDIVVVVGRAELTEREPASHEVPEYVAKYGQRMTRIAGSPAGFSAAYPVPMRIHPLKLRGH